MAALRVVVISLAALIVLALAAIVWRMYDLLAPDLAASLGTVSLQLPNGCHLLDAWSADGRLMLRAGEGPACDRVVILDLETGAVLGVVTP